MSCTGGCPRSPSTTTWSSSTRRRSRTTPAIARSALRYADEILIPCAPSPIEINRTTPVRDEIAEVREVRDKPVRSAVLLNRCVARAHSTGDAREALVDLGYDVLTTVVPRREVYAQSFGAADQAGRVRGVAPGGPGPHRAVRSAVRGPDMTPSRDRELRKAQMAAAAGRRAEPAAAARGPDRDPVQAGPDHPGPEPGAATGS